MTTPIHVWCSNFTQLIRREVVETTRCFCDKKVLRHFRRHFAPVWLRAPKVCRGAGSVNLRLPVEFRPNGLPICRSYSQKSDFVRSEYMPA